MRYYCLTLTDAASGLVWKPTQKGNGFVKSAGGFTFATTDDGTAYGVTDLGALNIEFDCPVYPYALPQGQAHIKVWGVGLPMIGQAANFNPDLGTGLPTTNFTLRAGMAKGLPLANPSQAGIVLQGQIYQAFGNWEGTNQTLDLICYAGAAGTDKNIVLDWAFGAPLSDAITASLMAAFGASYTINVDISANITATYHQYGHYDTLQQFADAMQQISADLGASIYGVTYQGVSIFVNGTTIYVSDGQGASTPKVIQLAFQDLIGQPTWIDSLTVNFKTVLRAGIQLDAQVQFPPGVSAPYALTAPSAAAPNAPVSSRTAFQGTFSVREAHHFANSRQADPESWATAYNAVALPMSAR